MHLHFVVCPLRLTWLSLILESNRLVTKPLSPYYSVWLFSFQIPLNLLPLLYFDPLVHFLRIIPMFNNHHTERRPDALDRAAKFLEVLLRSPHLLFGAAIWAYGAYWLLAVSGLA